MNYAALDGDTEYTTATGGHTLMVRNPKLDKLKDRLTPAQQFKRREKMMHKGQFRQETEKMLAQHTGALNAAFQGFKLIHLSGQRTRYAVYALALVEVANTAARYFGWW